jgi:LCP family protein required for cell wall assembly
VVTGVLAALVLMTSGIGWAYVNYLNGRITRVDPFEDLAQRPDTGAGDDLNILVVGSDSRAGVPKGTLRKLRLGGESSDCTDTIMLVHLNAARDRASVVSIPRDSYVELPEHRDRRTGQVVPASFGKINAAYTRGGPSLTVSAVERATNVRVDHYIEVNFLAFVGVVDKLGGVPMCTPTPLRDPRSGLSLPAGTTRLDGARALQYVRARHVEGDPTGDVGRMQRQQKFLTQVLAQAGDSGLFTNPIRLNDVVTSALGAVRVDDRLSAQELVRLGSRLRGLDGPGVTFAQIPLADPDHHVDGWGSTVLWDPARAKALFEAISQDRDLAPRPAPAPPGKGPAPAAAPPAPAPVDVAPGRVWVQVLNGTTTPGLGARAYDELAGLGFRMTGPPRDASAPSPEPHTIVRHDPAYDRSAATVAAALPGSVLMPAPNLGRTIEVVVGPGYAGVTPVRVASPAPVPGASGPASEPVFRTTTGDEVACR